MAEILEFGLKMSMLFGGSYQTQFTKAAQLMSDLQKKTQELQKSSGRITEFQKQQTSLNATRQKLESARERVRRLREEYRKSNNPSETMRKQLAKAQADAGRLSESFTNQQKKLAALNSELKQSGINTAHLSEAQSRLASQSDKVKAAQDRLINAQSKYNSLRSQLMDWGNIKGDILSSMALLKTFQKPIVIDMEFEQAMANVNAVMNPVKEEFDALRKQALQLGSTTQFTATQAAQAQEVLARAGLSVNEVIDAMPALLSMSAAEGLEIAQAADIIVNSLQGMRLSTGYADILTDLYAYTSAHSNTNIAELGEAMKAAAPVAATINLPAESLLALLGSMTSAARGGEAGTALASSLPRMYAPTTKARNAYAEIGVAYKTRSGGVVRPEILLENIAKKTKGLGTADQLRIYEAIFGKNHLSAMSALMQNIAGGTYTELHGGLVSKRDGSSSKMVSLRNNTLKGDITSLGSAWEGLMIRVGNALDPINRFFTQSITAGIQYLNELIDRMGPFADVLARGAYVLGGWMIVAKVYKYASLAVKTFGAFLELKAASKGLESLGAINTGLQAASQSATIFGVSLGKALGIIGAIAFATYEIVTHWKEITEWAVKAGEAISGIPKTGHEVAIPRGNINYGVSVMDSTFQPPEIIPHAEGGILTRPHLGLVAEAGPEAIIPLRDKQRGVSVLTQAAGLLGVEPQIFMARSDSDDGRLHYGNTFSINNMGNNRANFSPVINLTVNTSNNDTGSNGGLCEGFAAPLFVTRKVCASQCSMRSS